MSVWAEATLGEVADWSSGGTPKARTPDYYEGGDIPWAAIGDLTDGLVSTTGSTITEKGLAHSSAKILPQGTILVAMYGSIGKLGIAGRDMETNQAIATARPHGVESRFFFHYLLSQRSRLDAAGKGATQRNISQMILKSWPIRYPVARTEQRRIVDLLEDHLSRLDAAASDLVDASTKMTAMRERLVMDALTGVTVTGPRVPAALDAAGTLDGDLPALPHGWRWTRLGDVAEVVGGVTKDAKKQSDPALPDVSYLRVANVQRARLDLSNVTAIRVPPAKAEALRLQVGDVLMNEGGDRDKLARGWVWEGQVESCIHQNHVFRARVTDPDLDPYFLSWTTNTIGGRWAERNGRQSVNLASISLRTIRLMPVVVPPPGVATAVVGVLHERLRSLERMQLELASAAARGRALRRALLAAAFAGQLTGGTSGLDQVEELVEA